MKLAFSLFFIFYFFIFVYSQNINFIYKFYDFDKKLSEEIEIFSKLVSNDNRFWKTNFKSINCKNDEICDDEKINKSIIEINDSKNRIRIKEKIEKNSNNLKLFLLNIFQLFCHQFYIQQAAESFFFDKNIFSIHKNIYEQFEIVNENNFFEKLGEKSKFIHFLFYKNESFENWEALLYFIDSIEKTGLKGFLVNCEKFSSICDQFNIIDFPTLIAFKNEEIYQKFDLEFENDKIRDWILTLEQPIITKLSEDAVPYYRSGMIPGFDKPRDTVTILFVTTKNCKVYQNYAKIGKENHGKYHLTALISNQIKKWPNQPAFITMKPFDDYTKAFTLHIDLTFDRINNFLEEGLKPSIHQIISSQSFSNSLPKKSIPLLIFFDPLKIKNSQQFHILASKHQMGQREAYFSILQSLNIFSIYLMKMFKISNQPNYISIRVKEGKYCINSKLIEDEMAESQLLNWIKPDSACDSELESFQIPLKHFKLFEKFEKIERFFLNFSSKFPRHQEL